MELSVVSLLSLQCSGVQFGVSSCYHCQEKYRVQSIYFLQLSNLLAFFLPIFFTLIQSPVISEPHNLYPYLVVLGPSKPIIPLQSIHKPFLAYKPWHNSLCFEKRMHNSSTWPYELLHGLPSLSFTLHFSFSLTYIHIHATPFAQNESFYY